MAKLLKLTTIEQKLIVETIHVKSRFTAKNGDNIVFDGVIEIDSVTTDRAFVDYDQLLTFNGLPVFTTENAVLEDLS